MSDRTRAIAILNTILILGLVLAGFSGYHVLQHNAAVQEYVSVEGEIVSVDVVERVDEDGDVEYRPAIVYEYTIDGETYTSSNVFPGSFTRWSEREAWAQQWIAEYQPGEQVTIYLDPADPGSAYLVDDGLPNEWMLMMGVGLGFLVLGAWFTSTGFRRQRIRALIRDTPVEPLQALAIGPSAVRGTVETGEETVSLSSEEDSCSLAVYEVEDYHEGTPGSGGDVYLVDQWIAHEPFYLNDGTDRVRVEPSNAARYEFDENRFQTVFKGDIENGPEFLQQHFEGHTASWKSRVSGLFRTTRSFKQMTVSEGDELYVFGTVDHLESATGSRGERRVIRSTGMGILQDPLFLFSDAPPQDLIETRRWALLRLPYGAVMIVLSLAIFLLIFAPWLGINVPVLF